MDMGKEVEKVATDEGNRMSEPEGRKSWTIRGRALFFILGG